MNVIIRGESWVEKEFLNKNKILLYTGWFFGFLALYFIDCKIGKGETRCPYHVEILLKRQD
jgi:hypothetical protein